MSTLKDRLNADMRAAMKARDELTTSTLRMALAAVATPRWPARPGRELSDDEVLAVLTKEAKKRREAADRVRRRRPRRAGRARRPAEGRCSTATCRSSSPMRSWRSWSSRALAAGGFTGKAQMGPAMKAAQAAVAGRAEGGRVAAEVRRQLGRA